MKGIHNIVLPDSPSCLPTLHSPQVNEKGLAMFIDDPQGCKQAIGTGDLEQYRKFLKEAKLSDSDNRLKAAALENGFIPESKGLAAVDLENHEQPSPHSMYGI